MPKFLRIAIVLALVGGGVAYWVYNYEESLADDGVLTLYGNVDIRQASLGFRVAGRLERIEFEEGDRVGAGEVIARLDTTPLEHDFARARARQAEAEANLAKLERGFRPQEDEQARARVEELEAALVAVQKEYLRNKRLVEEDVIPWQTFDDTLSKRDQTLARLEAARQELSLRREGFRQEDIAAARAAVEATRAVAAGARTRLDDALLLAPSTGTLLTRVQEPGAVVAAGQTVCELTVDDPVWVRAYVSEPDLGLIHYGMAARVHTDSRPDKPYRGHIGFISPEAEFTPKSVQTEELRADLVYRLRIVADDPGGGLIQGMPVTVRIDVSDVPTTGSARHE